MGEFDDETTGQYFDPRIAAAQLDDTSIGRLLQDHGMVTEEKIHEANVYALAHTTKDNVVRLGEALVLLKHIDANTLTAFLAKQILARPHAEAERPVHAATIVDANAQASARTSTIARQFADALGSLMEKLK